jgi:uncharacterized protein
VFLRSERRLRTDAANGRRGDAAGVTSLRSQITARPTAAFFVFAFAISWSLMTPAMVTGGLEGLAALFFFLGVFGPAAAGVIVTRTTGGSVRTWLRETLKWRVPVRWYVAAIGFPVALAIMASAEFALAGESLDFGLVGERAVSFLPLFVYCLLINGGPEELGWRGFALPRLQRRLSPVRATFVLGTIWGLCICHCSASRKTRAMTWPRSP